MSLYISWLARVTSDSGAPAWRRPLVAVALTAAAAGLRLALDPLAQGGIVPFATFYVSTTLAALMAGPWAGALAVSLAALFSLFAFMEPAWSFALSPAVTVNITLFVVTQLAIVLFASVLRASLHRAARAEAALQAKVAELEAVMDLAPVGIWFAAGPEVREVTRNRYAVEMLRTPAESTAARGASVKGPAVLAHMELRRDGRALPPSQLPLQRALRGEESRNEEYEAVFADGSSIALLSNARPIRNAMGRITGAVSASLDVTALKRTEAALRDAIAQRELLQREADHRIKNSLQLVASVLRLQRGRVKDETAAALLDEAVARVSAVAGAHAALHRSPDLLAADAGAMVEELCHSIGRLNPEVAITCSREGEAMLEVERAMPLGLIVSELLTNAVRHAYPEGTQGRVEVRVAAPAGGEGLEVQVRDHGAGMPREEARDGSLGRELVRTFAAKIGAQVETRSAPGEGTTVTLRLPRRVAEAPAPAPAPDASAIARQPA